MRPRSQENEIKMTSWKTSEERQASARARYEEVMTTPAGPGTTAYTNAGVVGFVFGEMWQRGRTHGERPPLDHAYLRRRHGDPGAD